MITHKRARNNTEKVLDLKPRDAVLRTLAVVSQGVGCTLGPGGHTVLLERQEQGMPPFLTKDGVTVYKHLGFADPVQDAIMEIVRDAAQRTASEAGDGTSTSTILAEALVRHLLAYCDAHPQESPQVLARALHQLLDDRGYDFLHRCSVPAALVLPDGKPDEVGARLLRAVACVSANGDARLADAVIQASKLAGDYGNVIVQELSGPTEYRVERASGFSVASGYEESCKSAYFTWINDAAAQRCVLSRPRVLLYNGRVTRTDVLAKLLVPLETAHELVQSGNTEGLVDFLVHHRLLPAGRTAQTLDAEDRRALDAFVRDFQPHVVIVATGFSDEAVAALQYNWSMAEGVIKAFPLVPPLGPVQSYQQNFLLDLAAVSGAKVFSPVADRPDSGVLADLGPGLLAFEAHRTRSTFVGSAHENAPTKRWQDQCKARLAGRVQEVQKQAESAVSRLDAGIHRERLARLTGGLAVLTVVGGSNAEIRERRDRVEDATCAVRGAIRAGCLPGAGWALVALGEYLDELVAAPSSVDSRNDPALAHLAAPVREVLVPALHEPISRLLSNAGVKGEAAADIVGKYRQNARNYLANPSETAVWSFDLVRRDWVMPLETGLLDSAPAVEEALRSASAIALTLGTLGAVVAYARDPVFERQEAANANQYMRDAGVDDVNERA